MDAYGTEEEFLQSHIQSFKLHKTQRRQLPNVGILKGAVRDQLNTELHTVKLRQSLEPTNYKD